MIISVALVLKVAWAGSMGAMPVMRNKIDRSSSGFQPKGLVVPGYYCTVSNTESFQGMEHRTGVLAFRLE